MPGLLEAKSTLISGGGGGIGRATALAFARERARVAVADYRPLGDRVFDLELMLGSGFESRRKLLQD